MQDLPVMPGGVPGDAASSSSSPFCRDRRATRSSRHHHHQGPTPGTRRRSSSSRRQARTGRTDSSVGSASSARDRNSDCSSASSASSNTSCPTRDHHVENDKLAGLFMATKIEMLRMVETDLKLKLDLREMKERFYALLKNFEAFEQQQPSVQAPRQSRHERSSRRRLSLSRTTQRRHLETSSMAARCPNNTTTSSIEWGASRSSYTNNTAELKTYDYTQSRADVSDALCDITAGVSRVDNISAITQCSNVTYREQCSHSQIMDVEVPLSSTISYPQYSTPEKKKKKPASLIGMEALHKEKLADQVQRTPITAYRRRPGQSEGADLAESRQPCPIPIGALISRSGTNDSDSEVTPVAVRAVTRRLTLEGDESDSGMYYATAADTPSTTVGAASGSSSSNQETPRAQSQHYPSSCARTDTDDVSIEDVTPLPENEYMQSLKALDARLRRQTALPDLCDKKRSPVGLSETDLIDPSSSSFLDTTSADFQCSMNATRGASIANMSQLSESPMSVAESVETAASTDITSSTGAESSYKESDATTSSPPLAVINRSQHRRQQEARDHRFYSRQVKTLSQCTSGTSTSSCGAGSGMPGGFVAPTNSLNATSDSAPSAPGSVLRRERTSSRRQATRLGVRPPCVGSDLNLIAIPQVPRATSDPETVRLGSARIRPTSHLTMARALDQQQHSGTSSGASSCSSTDRSTASLPITSKESRVSCIGIPVTPNGSASATVTTTPNKAGDDSEMQRFGSVRVRPASHLTTARWEEHHQGASSMSVTPNKNRSTGARRSLSKRLKKIGKQLWRAGSKGSKDDAQHSV